MRRNENSLDREFIVCVCRANYYRDVVTFGSVNYESSIERTKVPLEGLLKGSFVTCKLVLDDSLISENGNDTWAKGISNISKFNTFPYCKI